MGLSEERIGQFLSNLSPNDRHFFKIATKGGIDRKNFDDKGTVIFDNSKEFLTEELNNSLKRLGVDCVELYYVHRREADRSIEEVTETLVGFIKAGKIKQFGFFRDRANIIGKGCKNSSCWCSTVRIFIEHAISRIRSCATNKKFRGVSCGV
ncbi:aldo/keto reductase, partial [Paracoccaceae bacterium]|nr:aldo/keto reductase [Paracoccaceae bacterium]